MQFLGKFQSPAKINLFLRVIGKRSDGFSEIQSLFAFLDLCDGIEFFLLKKSEENSYLVKKAENRAFCRVEFLGEYKKLLNPNHNLFTKIFDFFVKKFVISDSIFIRIDKKIPVGAGLGGGSSNAAIFIAALNRFFSLGLNKSEMQKIALNFGSDIAFFFEEKACLVFGRGDILQEFQDFDPLEILLVNPGFFVETAAVFRSLGSDFCKELPRADFLKENLQNLLKNQPNQLTKAAISLCPKISEILTDFTLFLPQFAKMSGSGATCFAGFQSEKELQNCQNFLQKKLQLDYQLNSNFDSENEFFNQVSPLVSRQKILSTNPALSKAATQL